MIDLGLGPGAGAAAPAGPDIPRQLQAAIVAAGFTPVIGDGVDDALAGRDLERDAAALAAAMATAEHAFGALACADVVPAARQAIGVAAARQAAGRPVPELPRAWAYVLLCADRDGQIDAAQQAAGLLRALGGSPDVPAAVWSKYPEVDAIAGHELVGLDIDTDEPGAAIWIDFQPVGASPVHVQLPAGEHVIAAAVGTRRGWAAGTAVRTQKAIHVPLTEAAGPWADVARRIAGWGGKLPSPTELAWVLDRVHARIALIRRGDRIEAWGQVGRSEAPHPLGGDDGASPIADVGRVLGVVADRIGAWNAHAPDPDMPLLTEDTAPRGARKDQAEGPTKWWVYAAIGGAIAIGATIIIAHEAAGDRQRVELHYP
ncbi:MAG TPA: hypothetical protein VHW23_11380 [Kofleriaceae bacterium]|nr:hypothetical protein [Kofleriaceae bacterium]